MERFTKITLIAFLILSIFTVTLKLWSYEDFGTLIAIIFVLLFNFSLFFVIVLTANKIAKISKKNYLYFIFCFLVSFLIYWYLTSSFIYFYYGNFISLGGLLFFAVTQSFLMKLTMIVIPSAIILFLSFIFYRYSVKKYKSKKDNKRIYIIIAVIILITLIFSIPKKYSPDTSPFIDFFKRFFRTDYLDFQKNPTEIHNGSKILNISLNIEKPNIVMILLESVSAEHIHFHGYERNITPNIDWLAEQGIVFTSAHSSASHSGHAQPTFLSSRYTLINKYRNFYNQDYPREFIWDILKKQNYSTSFISSQNEKWANMINYYKKENLDLFWHSPSDNAWDAGSGNEKKDYDEVTAEKAMQWIDSLNNQQPFFVYINFQATHYPYNYPKNNSIYTPDEPSIFTTYMRMDEDDYNATINRYDNSLHYVDRQIGKIINYLENKSLLNNTIIILSSDHGESFEEKHGYIRHGFGVYEEEIKVPLIFLIPNQNHTIINERVRTIDTTPTILDILNFSQSPHFQGGIMKENQNIFIYSQNQNIKIGLIKGDIKYIWDYNTDLIEAYNLTIDSSEQNNLIKTEEDEIYYTKEYGSILFRWYNCQLDYYSKELWEQNILIDCS